MKRVGRKIKTFNEFLDVDDSFIDEINMKVDHIVDGEEDYLLTISLKDVNICDNEDYFIMVGYNPVFEIPRLKIINKNTNKCFVIILKNFRIVGNYDKKIFTDDVIENIENWYKLNEKLIINFSLEKENIDIFKFASLLKKL